jgi:hypothetical protein|tara:strand:- start:863 stop:1483 length:621 start_codon:yes stop_codon:yes gene_type:complete
MDVWSTTSVWIAIIALLISLVSGYLTITTHLAVKRLRSATELEASKRRTHMANAMSDASVVWQRLASQCDELNLQSKTSPITPQTQEVVDNWIEQLRKFCVTSKAELDKAYKILLSEALATDPMEFEIQLPDLEKLNKEMKSNVVAISEQLEHVRKVLLGVEVIGNQQFKVTLHKPSLMPQARRKKKKLAELRVRNSTQTLLSQRA